jgi:CDP-glucose 4,6-dehydratase
MEIMEININTDIFNHFFENKKILLTGHTGFKGSWLAIWLKSLGADVYGYALEPTNTEDNFVVCGIFEKINHKIGNILDKNQLFNYFEEIKPDIVFHLAAQALVLESYENPSDNFEVNIQGTINVLEAIRKTPSIKSAIMVTSDKCYDNKEWIWGYRENEPFGGKDPYSASKGACEIVIQSYIHSFF